MIPIVINPPPLPHHLGLPNGVKYATNDAAAAASIFPAQKFCNTGISAVSNNLSLGTQNIEVAFTASSPGNLCQKKNIWNLDSSRFAFFYRTATTGLPTFAITTISAAGVPTVGSIVIANSNLTFVHILRSVLNPLVFLVMLSNGAVYKVTAPETGNTPSAAVFLCQPSADSALPISNFYTLFEWGRSAEDCLVFTSKDATAFLKYALYTYTGTAATFVTYSSVAVSGASIATAGGIKLNRSEDKISVLYQNSSTQCWTARISATPSVITIIRSASPAVGATATDIYFPFNDGFGLLNGAAVGSKSVLITDAADTATTLLTSSAGAIGGLVNGENGWNGVVRKATTANTFKLEIAGVVYQSAALTWGASSAANTLDICFNSIFTVACGLTVDASNTYICGADVSTL